MASLDWDQISGLSDAARESLEAFTKSAEALGLLAKKLDQKPEPKPSSKSEPVVKKETAKPQKKETTAKHDPETGEITDESPETSKSASDAAQDPKTPAANPSLNFGD